MISWKVLNSLSTIKFCKGSILSVRIYADVKGGKCSCGGLFSKRINHPDDKLITLPVCAECNKDPALYVIDADAKDANGNKIRLRIRNTKDKERLDSKTKVSYIISVIQREMMEGTFNVHHYDSATAKDAYIFKNYLVEYLAHQDRRLLRGEISPGGLHEKKGLIKRELFPYFEKMELFRINHQVITKFRDTYTSKLRTRDLALGELKALLNQAARDGMINLAPKFVPIPRSKTRDEIISYELAVQTVEKITKEIYRDMYTLLLIYPIRPGELRALTWKNMDLLKGEFIINQHFSGGILIDGRKSIKKDKKEGSLPFPVNDEARFIFLKYRTANVVSLNSFVFLSHTGKQVSEDALWEAWSNARKKLGHTFAPYECRHVAASELYKKMGGDIIRLKKVIGMTNTATLERYVHDRSDNSDLFQ